MDNNLMDINSIPENYQDDIRKAMNLLKNEGCKAVFLFGSMVTGNIHKKPASSICNAKRH